MAIVADLSGNGKTDRKLATPNRSNAGTPVGALTPSYPAELVLDTTNRVLWRAVGTANTDWVPEN